MKILMLPLTMNIDYFLDIESENAKLKAKIEELTIMAKIDGLEIVMTKQMQKMIDKELKKRFEELKPELATRYEELLNIRNAEKEENNKLRDELARRDEDLKITDGLLKEATETIGAVVACCTYNANEDARIGIYGIDQEAFTRIDQFITHYNDAVSAGKVSVDVKPVKRDLSDAEIEELGAQEAERKEFCPNCEAETPCTHEAELYVCDICGEDFAKYIVSRNSSVSDASMTQDVLIDIKTRKSIEIEELEEVVEHLQIRLSEWRGVARQLADELKEEISSKCTVIWEDVGETSPAWIAYNNLVDTEDYETNPDYYNHDYQSPWISITSGRPPEKFQECIVLDKRRHVHNWIHDDALLPLFAQYTHWMPLPEPPESEV